MTATTTSSVGKFIWRELITHDVEGAKRFYENLFGWNWESMPMEGDRPAYAHAALGDDYVAGILELECEQPNAFWVPYVYVADVDGAVQAAVACGAHVAIPPTDMPEVGRLAFLNDPQGAPVYLFRPASGEGEETQPRVGEFCWEHLNTSDPTGAIAFYTKVVGWDTLPIGEMSFFTRDRGTKPVAVISQAPAGVPSHWLSYVMVDDLAATNAKAKALGGEVIEERIEVPGKGAFALLKDPYGALFMLSEPSL